MSKETRDRSLELLTSLVVREVLEPEQEQVLLRAARAGDVQARHRLIESQLWYIVKLAGTLKTYRCDLSDLVGEGVIALSRAIDRINLERTTPLLAYAKVAVLRQMRFFRRHLASPLSVPDRLVQPDTPSYKKFVEAIKLARQDSRLQTLADPGGPPGESLEDEEILAKTREYLETLEGRPRQVLEAMLAGLGCKQAAKLVGLTRQGFQAANKRVIKGLRAYLGLDSANGPEAATIEEDGERQERAPRGTMDGRSCESPVAADL